MNNIEKELKLALNNENEYLMLLNYFNNGISYEQHNIFFDSKENILRKNFLALRLRVENNKFTITLKGPKIIKDEITIRDELECKISSDEAYEILNGEKNIIDINCFPIKHLKSKIIKDLKDIKLFKILEFKNLRTTFPFLVKNKNYFIELDKTYFKNGNKEFELEAEFHDDNSIIDFKNKLKEIFDKNNINWTLSSESKFSKALKFNS